MDETTSLYFGDGGSAGNLTMTGGIYKIERTGITVPAITGQGGAYSISGGVIELDGSGNQTFRGARDYYSLTFGNTGTKTLSSSLNANSIDGVVTIQNAAILDTENNDFSGPGGLTMTGTSLFRMRTLNVTLPQLTGVNFPYLISSGTIELYGSGVDQTHSLRGTYGVSSTNIAYNNIEINATAASINMGYANVVAQAGFSVAGTMNVNSPACFQIASIFTITGSGIFDLKPGSTLKYGGSIENSGAIGNIQTATRNFPSTASYGFVGVQNPQTVGNALPSSMINMYLDKESNQIVLLAQNTNVENTLHLMKGKIDLNNFNLSLGTNSADASISGGNNESYVIGWDGADNGNLLHFVNNDVGQYFFPIGDLTSYTPIEVKFNTGTSFLPGNPMLIAKVIGTSHPNKVNAMHYLDHYWNVEPIDFDSTNYNIWFDYDDADLAGTETAMYPCKYNSMGWIFRNDAPASYVQGSGTTNYSTNRTVWNDLTYFSDFTLIGGGDPLPIELLSFTAFANDQVVDLKWITVSETNNDFFTIERSIDAQNFTPILDRQGAGNSNSILTYFDYDMQPYHGVSYYRLKQTDFNGDFSYSNIVAVQFNSKKEFDVVVFGNSSNNEISNFTFTHLNNNVKIEVCDASGRIVMIRNIAKAEAGVVETLNFQNLKQGIYFMRFISGDKTLVKRWLR